MLDLVPTEWEKRAQGFDTPDLIRTLRMRFLCPVYKYQLPMGHVSAVPKSPAGDCHHRAAGSD